METAGTAGTPARARRPRRGKRLVMAMSETLLALLPVRARRVQAILVRWGVLLTRRVQALAWVRRLQPPPLALPPPMLQAEGAAVAVRGSALQQGAERRPRVPGVAQRREVSAAEVTEAETLAEWALVRLQRLLP
jgi:hypothetical protein